MRALVTGGAGYVGSVVVEELIAAGAEAVVVLDDLSTGHASAVTPPARLVRGDIGDAGLVEELCIGEKIDVVIHMAASSIVSRSMSDPSGFYRANLTKGLALLDAILDTDVDRFVFSSTAAVYGATEMPIDEDAPLRPMSPYGETKLAFERALEWYGRAYGLQHISLRYFNAAGATTRNGERHWPETHLIPNVLQAALDGSEVTIFGGDYPLSATPDGTCVRDYVHVSDLARAHLLAIDNLARHPARAYNLGGTGAYSVRQVIETAAKVTGRSIRTRVADRRKGDPCVLVASSERARRELGWTPQKDLETIIADAWAWTSLAWMKK
jgi:UDP-glucose 4-epimerase